MTCPTTSGEGHQRRGLLHVLAVVAGGQTHPAALPRHGLQRLRLRRHRRYLHRARASGAAGEVMRD